MKIFKRKFKELNISGSLIYKGLFPAVVLLLFAGEINTLQAQITKKAQVGFRFLENPVSAEVMGRGGVGVATTLTSNGIFWNPALIGLIEPNVDVSYNYTKGIADINYNAAAAAIHLGNFGVLGFSLLAMDYGTFVGTERADNSQGYIETGNFSPTAIAVGTAFSQKVSNRFSYGVHVKYVHQNLGSVIYSDSTGETKKYAQGTIAFDVGAYYDFLYNGIRFGAVLQNVSRELKYETDEFPLPFAVSFGITVEPLQFINKDEKTSRLILSFESRHPRDFGEKVKFGAEYRFMETFILRTGYEMNYDERGFSAGVGINQEVSGIPFRIDYAFEPFGIFGNVHFISVGVSYK
jgi:hypothetical protein